MAGSPEHARDLLRQAAAARVNADVQAARAAYAKAYDAARQIHDVEVMGEAALGLASGQLFGTHPGRVPAFLFEAYSCAVGARRTRLAVALARAWVYGGSPQRAVEFAAEAVAGADAAGDAILLAEALDARLLVSWGPDDLPQRLEITSRLEDTVAHLTDVEVRMSAHLWRLTTALECLDVVSVRRQLKALDRLADESGSARVRFFASSRLGMHALMIGDLASAASLRTAAMRAGEDAGEADTPAIDHTLAAGIARQSGDRDALAAEAAVFEEFGTAEAVPSVIAEGAQLWLAAGEVGRARALTDQVAGTGFGAVPRDVDWLLTVATLTEVAAATGAAELAAEGVRLLEPYTGRGVVNGGGVAFCGVVDGFLSQACGSLGRADEARQWARAATRHNQRVGATWWLRRLDASITPDASSTPQPARTTAALPQPAVAFLQPGPNGVWTIGLHGAVTAVREMKGFQYLRLLLRQPGVEIPALKLSDWVSGHPGGGVDDSGTGELIDRRALAAYRRRIADLDAELGEAREWADEARVARLRMEREALLDEISAAAGLGGRPRQAGATGERARVAVRKAVAAAIDRIAAVDPLLGRVLRDCVHTGAVCRYDADPARPVDWITDHQVSPAGLLHAEKTGTADPAEPVISVPE